MYGETAMKKYSRTRELEYTVNKDFTDGKEVETKIDIKGTINLVEITEILCEFFEENKTHKKVRLMRSDF